MSDLLELFFEHYIEDDINHLILADREYRVPKDRLQEYVDKLLTISYDSFVSYAYKNSEEKIITPQEITQSSSFESCEIEMCAKLMWINNPGLSFEEVGQLFPEKVVTHNSTSFKKYGENQIKTAAQLGLVFVYYDHWYLSCLGYLYCDLCDNKRKSLLARAILRNPLYAKMAGDILHHDVAVDDYMDCLSHSTKLRRAGSVSKLMSYCVNEMKKESIPVFSFITSVRKE